MPTGTPKSSRGGGRSKPKLKPKMKTWKNPVGAKGGGKPSSGDPSTWPKGGQKKKKENWLTKNSNENLKKVLGAAENIAALGAGNPPSASVNGAKDVSTGEGKSTENGQANDNDTNYGPY